MDPAGEADPAGSPPGGPALIHIDGAARGNPGPAGIGVVLEDRLAGTRREVCRYLGEATNNAAEYHALLTALEIARQAGIDRVHVLSDSELIVRQVRGEYRVRHPVLQKLHQRVREALRGFREITVDHVPRAENAEADRLANRAIDEYFKGRRR